MYIQQEWFIKRVLYIGDSSVSEWMHSVSMVDDEKIPQVYKGVCSVSIGVHL